MTRYIVLEHGEGPSAQAVFLRDRFYIVAFVLPFVWFASHRLYLFAALSFLVQGALLTLARVEGFGPAAFVLTILFGLAVALEGPRLVAARLRRRGYREAAVIHASDLDEVEIRYFERHGRPVEAPAEPAPAAPGPRAALPLTGWRSGRTLLDPGAR